jgi:diguanylate cyclase (GGDEF)-like protein/PAS domain S-box-containing protein
MDEERTNKEEHTLTNLNYSATRFLQLERHLQMKRLLVNIATRLARCASLDQGIDASLGDMGSMVGADRAYVFHLRHQGATMDNTYEWCSPGVSQEMDNLQGLAAESMPWLMEQLRHGQAFQIKDVAALPLEAKPERAILEAQRIRSCLIMPMHRNQELVGFVGFDNVRESFEWPDEDIELLKVATQLISDFFAREQARQALDQSLQRQMAILENIPDIAWLKDEKSRFIFVNEQFARSAGICAEELVHKTDLDVWPDALAKRYRQDDKDVMQTRRPKRVEEPLVDRGQGERIIETIKTPIFDVSGKVIGTTGIARDITERKQTELALIESEQRYRRLVEALPAIVYRYSNVSGANYWSPQVEAILGYTQHDLKENAFIWHEAIHPDDLPLVDKAIEEFEAGVSIDLIYRIRHKNGSWLWLHDRSVGRHEHHDEVVIEGVAFDITELKQAERALQRSEQNYRLLVENQTDLVVKVDMEGRFQFVSPSYCNIFGKSEAELIGHRFMPLVHEDDQPRTAEVMEALHHPPYECYVEQRAKTSDGWRWLAWADKTVLDATGKPESIVGVGRDISAQKALEQALHMEREKALVTLHSIGDAVISTDAKGRVELLNPIAEALTGWSANEVIGRPLKEFFLIIDQETRKPIPDPVERCLDEGQIVNLADHTILVSRSFDELAIEVTAAPIAMGQHEVVGVVLVFRDVSEARKLSQQVSYQATHDPLTGLINRTELERRLARVLETAHSESTQNAFCYLDLDQFKLVNDTCGHVAGDELLRQLGRLLENHIRKRDTLARLGGDEFGLLIEHCSIDEARAIAENLIGMLGDFSFPWEDHSFSIGVSIGLVSVDHQSKSMGDILRAADSACYIAKEQGRNRVHVHQDDDEEQARRYGEMQWAVRIPRALNEQRFQLYFQEIMPIQDVEPAAGHFELLLRMQDENGKLIMPGAFLPAAERYNLSDKLDRWVISHIFNWFERHPAQLQQLNLCSINLSGLSLNNQTFLQFVIDQLENSSIAPRKICFEITETVAIANLSSAIRFISSLRELGCHFALDDFGSGLSSFAYLKNLPVDFLKIDGQFVKDILDDPMDLAMVKSINEIGHVMGKKTIAEFVENVDVLNKLKLLGVDYAQGYGIGRPKPIDEALAG